MISMTTTTIKNEYGAREAEVTLCGRSVVVERYGYEARVVTRGGYVVGGERVYECLHQTEEQARADAESRIAAERARV